MPTEPSNEPVEVERSGSFVSGKVSTDPVVVRTARTVRRVGAALAIVGIAITTIPVTIGIVSGIVQQDIHDPYSNRAMTDRNTPREAADCSAWGVELVQARERGANDPQGVEDWWARCGQPSWIVPRPESQLDALRRVLHPEPAKP